MKRAIVTPPTLAAEALDELKAWLAITTTGDDGPLEGLLKSALEMFEAFTGQMPLEATCKEMLPATGEWQRLSTLPVQAIIGLEGQNGADPAFGIPTASYAFDLDADGSALVRLHDPALAERFAVTFIAGMASGWSALPEAVRHGVMRLAAHNYRQRDTDAGGPVPPASIAALWRPWRRMRLT